MILMIVMMKDPDDINIVFRSPVQLVFQIKKLQKKIDWTGVDSTFLCPTGSAQNLLGSGGAIFILFYINK